MLTPPEKNSASTTLMRMPSRTSLRRDLDRRQDVRQPKHVDRQPRRHEVVGAVRSSISKAEQADDDAAVHRVRIPRTVGDRVGMKASRSSREERLVCHGGRPWRVLEAKSRALPAPYESAVAKADDPVRRASELEARRTGCPAFAGHDDELRRAATPRGRSHRSRSSTPLPPALQTASRAINCDSAHTAAPRTSGLASSSSRSASAASAASSGVADRDQHVAHKAVAADALDRRFREQRAKRGIVEPRQIRQRRRAQLLARGEFGFAPCLRELVPRADRQAIVAAIDAVADRLAEFVRDRALVLDREIGNAAPRIELVRRGKRRRSGRYRDRPGTSRNDRRRLRRAAVRAWCRSRRETARSRIRATPDWCACPASPVRPPAPAAFPSRRRCRRTP